MVWMSEETDLHKGVGSLSLSLYLNTIAWHGMAWHCLLHSFRLWHFHCCELENLLSSIVLRAFFQSTQQLLPPIFIDSIWLWHETVCVHFVAHLPNEHPITIELDCIHFGMDQTKIVQKQFYIIYQHRMLEIAIQSKHSSWM